MDLSKKTTILFSPHSHRRLSELAERRGVSMGELVREPCATAYGIVDHDAQVSAVASLAALSLPVAAPRDMKHDSVAPAHKLMPR